MKRLLTVSFITLALVVGAVGAAPIAHAADDCATTKIEGASCNTSKGTGTCQYNGEEGWQCLASSVTNPAAGSADKKATDYTAQAGDEAYNGIMIRIMTLFAWLVGAAAVTLDYAVYYTVVVMGDYVKNLTAVGVTWRIMRDIGNIFLIFGFLAIGICTILDVKWYGGGTSMLPKLLLAAVFLNFSLFFTQVIIDTGNLFATQFYTQIKGGTIPSKASLSTGTLQQIENNGVSTKLMSQLGLTSIYGSVQNNERAKDILKGGNPWVIGFMAIILFLITAFVMFSLAFILIARFVVLLFLIIVAPIGFAGMAIPNLSGLASKWWSKLFEQTITAPVLLLLLYVALAVITDTQFLTGFNVAGASDGWIGTAVNNVGAFAPLLLSFLVAMGLLIAVVIASKSLSAFGADGASKLAGKLTFGATAFVGRRTVGRASNFAARKIRSTGFGQSETGRMIAGGLDRGAKANFDIRGIKAGGGLKAIGGIDAGEAQKGGYRAREDELIKVRTDYAKTLKQTDAQKAENKKIMDPLKKQENDQLAASKILIDKSRDDLKAQKARVEAARARGDKTALEAEAKVLDSMSAEHKELRETEAEKLSPIREKIKNEDKRFKSAAQTAYGKSLEKKRTLLRPYDVTTATGSARREAAAKILKDAGKDDVDKIKEWIESEEGRRATPTTPPSPPPSTPAGPAST